MFAVVQFSFSTATLLVGENEILPNRLSIIKTGQAEPTIRFQVFVYPVEGGPDETGTVNNYYGQICEPYSA